MLRRLLQGPFVPGPELAQLLHQGRPEQGRTQRSGHPGACFDRTNRDRNVPNLGHEAQQITLSHGRINARLNHSLGGREPVVDQVPDRPGPIPAW